MRDINVKASFMSCAKCARDGAGGAIISHAGCLLAPAIAGVLGGGVSGTFMAAAMYVTSPLIAMGATYSLDRMRGRKSSLAKLFGSAAVALVVAFGINSFAGHDHGQHDPHHHHDMTPSRQWLESQTPEKRRQIEENARALGLSPPEYARTICNSGPEPLNKLP